DVIGEPPTTKAEIGSIDGTGVSRGFLPTPAPGTAPDLVDVLGDLVDPWYENGGSTTHYPSKATVELQRRFRTSQDGSSVASKGSLVSEHDYSKHSPPVLKKFKAMI